jgi:hypothetical protein
MCAFLLPISFATRSNTTYFNRMRQWMSMFPPYLLPTSAPSSNFGIPPLTLTLALPPESLQFLVHTITPAEQEPMDDGRTLVMRSYGSYLFLLYI